MKKGQVTIFAIIGIALIVVFVFSINAVFDLRDLFSRSQKEKIVSQDYIEGHVRSTTNNCLKETSIGAISAVARYAGYISPTPEPKYDETGSTVLVWLGNEQIPAVLTQGYKIMLPEADVARRICIKTYIDMKPCLESAISDYDEKIILPDFQGDFENISKSCTAILKNDSVIIRLNYPITAEKDGFTVRMDGFSVEHPIPLQAMMVAARAFTELVRRSGTSHNLEGTCEQQGFLIRPLNQNVAAIEEYVLTGETPVQFRFGLDGHTLTGSCN